MATALLGCTTASAQTPPTPTHTFQPAGASGTFGTAGNWSPGLPGAANDVLIADGKTANGMTQTEANTLFGSLTLGVGSTLNLAASNTTGLAANSVLYFNNGSQLNYTSGGTNRANTYNIVSGATVGMHLGQGGSDSLPQGTMVGGSNTVVNMTAANLLNMRLNAGSFNGTLNHRTNVANNARAVNYGNAGNSFGSGTLNIDTFVRVTGSKSNLINDSGTLQLTGSSGGASNVKFDMGASTDTIGGLTIDTPIGATASAPTYRGSNTLTVSGTTTFQGTAGDVNFDSSNGTPSSHNLITTGNMTFGGTGTWAVSGDGRIRLNAASGTRTITTNTNASISSTLVGTQGFTKAGTGTLTLTGDLTNLNTSGDITLSAGQLFFNGATNLSRNVAVTGNAQLRSTVTIPGISISTGGTLNIGTATAVETLTASAFSVASTGTAISFQYSGNGVNDQIIAPTLNLTGVAAGGITINGTSLGGYDAQVGDIFTLFSGTVTGFDVSKFVLNMPVLTGGNTWKIQEGSLQLVVIPEPSGILLSGIALMGLILRRRR